MMSFILIEKDKEKEPKIKVFMEIMTVFKLSWIKKILKNTTCGIIKDNSTVFMTLPFKTKDLT